MYTYTSFLIKITPHHDKIKFRTMSMVSNESVCSRIPKCYVAFYLENFYIQKQEWIEGS